MNKQSFSRICILWILFFPLFLNACRNRSESAAKPPATESVQPQTIRIGLLPEQDIFTQKERYQPLADYLSRKLSIHIRLVILAGYSHIVKEFKRENLDGAFCGSLTGALAIRKLGAEPLVRLEYPNGASTSFGMVFTRKGSDIQTAADMKGKRLALVDRGSATGWLLPLYFFHTLGINNPQAWFGEIYYTGTHEDVILDVTSGAADIGAVKNTVFNAFVSKHPHFKAKFKILATSPPFPTDTLVVGRNLSQDLKDRLKTVLLAMDRTAGGKEILKQFGAARFVPTGVRDYVPVFEFIKKSGLNFAHFDRAEK